MRRAGWFSTDVTSWQVIQTMHMARSCEGLAHLGPAHKQHSTQPAQHTQGGLSTHREDKAHSTARLKLGTSSTRQVIRQVHRPVPPHLRHGPVCAHAVQVHDAGSHNLVGGAARVHHRLDMHRSHSQRRRLPAAAGGWVEPGRQLAQRQPQQAQQQMQPGAAAAHVRAALPALEQAAPRC